MGVLGSREGEVRTAWVESMFLAREGAMMGVERYGMVEDQFGG